MRDPWGNQWPDQRHPALTNPYPLGSMGRPSSFRSARVKLQRAKEVHESMNRERERLVRDLHDSLRIQLSDDGKTYRFFVDEPPPIPSHWPVTIGEVLYNLRSALDHAAYELSVIGLNRELNPDEAKNSAFPLVTEPGKFTPKYLDRVLPGVSDTTRALIERVQPYPERDRFYRPTAFEEATYHLGLLNELGNIEKHRHPNFVVESVGPGSHLQGLPTPDVFEGALEPGRMVARMDYYPEFKPGVYYETVLLQHPARASGRAIGDAGCPVGHELHGGACSGRPRPLTPTQRPAKAAPSPAPWGRRGK